MLKFTSKRQAAIILKCNRKSLNLNAKNGTLYLNRYIVRIASELTLSKYVAYASTHFFHVVKLARISAM